MINTTATTSKKDKINRQTFPFLDLPGQFESIRVEIMAAVTRVMESQHFILGPEVKKLEEESAAWIGAEFAVGCASGSDALLLALVGLGVKAGDEVITTPFTFVATAGSIARIGAKPVFVDIDPHTYNLDARQIEGVITPRTRAIMPVHLFGLSAEMDAILDIGKRHNLYVIEDAAQAIGARYKGCPVGTLGNIGCFSFFPSKNLGGAGDGGLLTTNDPEIADRLTLLRSHGSRQKYCYEILGMNSRLDALQAAILRVKLKYLLEWTEARRDHARQYYELFSSYRLDEIVQLPLEPDGLHHVYNQFTIRVRKRDELREFLRQNGIPTEVYYPLSLHEQPAFKYLGYPPEMFSVSQVASSQVLALPIYPELMRDQQDEVVSVISQFYHQG